MPFLRIRNGVDAGRVIEIGPNAMILGRDPKCNAQLKDKGASRNHSEIFRVGEMCLIRDLGSRNGTYVNDERIEEELLREGDLIRIATTELVFESTDKKNESKLNFHDDREFKSTLELRIDDLYVGEADASKAPNFRALLKSIFILKDIDDEQETMQKILGLVTEVMPADNVYIFLRDPKTRAITPKVWIESVDQRQGVPISTTILKTVIAEGKALMTSNAMDDERFSAGESIMMNQIKGVLCAPLTSRGDTFGAIYAANVRSTEAFEEKDLELLTALGSNLALALQNVEISRKRTDQLYNTIGTLVSLFDVKASAISASHAKRVSEIAVAIAEEMKLGHDDRDDLGLAALIHDIGRHFAATGKAVQLQGAGASAALQSETGDKAAEVRNTLERMRATNGFNQIKPVIQHHHENFDGTGVPDGLKGEAIPKGARILSVANAFDVLMTAASKPSYRNEKKTLIEIGNMAGEPFDPEVVKALMLAFRHGRLKDILAEYRKLPAGNVESSSESNESVASSSAEQPAAEPENA
ncbi:MAG TPA: HD domain-containing phosphohydrolase [Planctomycetota bacterium]|nr:HD domain-containing phosphohydrolase [Planctomycetota bacterium]